MVWPSRFAAGLMLLPGLVGIPGASAHPISLTTALVNVEEDQAIMELDVMVEDLILFYESAADPGQVFELEEIKNRALKHRDFLVRHLHLTDLEGRRIPGRVVGIDFSQIPPKGIDPGDFMQYSLVYRLAFELPEGPPEILTVSQDFGGERPAVPSEMNVFVFLDGVYQDAARLSHRTSHPFVLDPDRPTLPGETLEDYRRRLLERREESPPITSYSQVYSYLYLTPVEVRLELLVPLLTLEEWTGLPRQEADRLGVGEQQRARETTVDFITEHSNMEINGRRVEPIVDRFDFFGPDHRDFSSPPPERPVGVFNARAGVVLSYPALTPPEQVVFEWDYYTPRFQHLVPRIYIFDEPGIDFRLDEFRPQYAWRGEVPMDVQPLSLPPPEPLPRWRVPVLSVVLASGAVFCLMAACRRRTGRFLSIAALLGVAAVLAHSRMVVTLPPVFGEKSEPAGEEVAGTIGPLLWNLYRAFEYRTEERIYDALAESVSGDLLEELYLAVQRNLQVDGQGGARARVEAVDLLHGEARSNNRAGSIYPAFEYRAVWEVDGILDHWGHVHTRKNRYEAVFTVEGTPEGWRITGFTPLVEEPLEQTVRLRK